MGKLWEDCTREELILNYSGILWGLRERCHTRVRCFDGINYAIPQICTEQYFTQQIEPGMLAAKKTIEAILGDNILECELKMMSSEESDIRELGWKAYKAVTIAGLEFAGRGAA